MTTKFSGFSVGTAPGPTDQIVGLQGGGNVRWTVALFQALFGATYAQLFGDGSSVSYVITHNLGTRDVDVTVYRNSSPWDEIICDVQHTSTNTITLIFSTAPAVNQLRVKVST